MTNGADMNAFAIKQVSLCVLVDCRDGHRRETTVPGAGDRGAASVGCTVFAASLEQRSLLTRAARPVIRSKVSTWFMTLYRNRLNIKKASRPSVSGDA